MSTQTHPYRSAPFTEVRPPFPTRRFCVMVAAILALHSRDDIARWQSARDRRNAIAAARHAARAEMNARAYVRSAYGVDPEAAEHWPWAVTADTAAALRAKAGAR